MYKKLLKINVFLIAFLILISVSVSAEQEDTIQEDFRCTQLLIQTNPDVDPICNRTCTTRCLNIGFSCPYGNSDPDNGGCIDLADQEIENPDAIEYFNFIGINWGPINKAVPRFVRLILFTFFSFESLMAIGYGIYGMWVRTTAQDSPEKVEESTKIYKNAIIGVAIGLGGVIFIQIAALIAGLEGNVFSFNFFPPQGAVVELEQGDVKNGICNDGQVGQVLVNGVLIGEYLCEDGRWTDQPIN